MHYYLNGKGFSILQEFEKIKKGELTRKQVANMFGYNIKTINKKYKNYLLNGVESLIHKNSGKIPQNKLNDELENKIVDLYITEYQQLETSFTQYIEIVKKRLNIEIKSKHILIKIIRCNGVPHLMQKN